MASSSSSSNPLLTLIIIIIFTTTCISSSPTHALPQTHHQSTISQTGGRGRSLLSLKETPRGGNSTFQCSPSGPCVPCLYSEKNDKKYRCSETGYRIPLKCEEVEGLKKPSKKKSQKSRVVLEQPSGDSQTHNEDDVSGTNHRRLGDDRSTVESGRQTYITYRSCIPAVNEEKLSVLGFEGIMLFLLLVSGPFIYFKRKRTVAASVAGAVRIPTNSRF